MSHWNRCEICNKQIKVDPPHSEVEVEYYLGKRSDDDKIMYRHEDCPHE